jgi:hypothetical protein
MEMEVEKSITSTMLPPSFRDIPMFSPNSPTRKAASLFVTLALFLIVGGPWAVLQTIAWAKMVVDYSRDNPVSEAISKTFDGEHPCAICKKISKVRGEERKSPALVFQIKKDGSFISLKSMSLTLPTVTETMFYNVFSVAYPSARFEPPIPVPRA